MQFIWRSNRSIKKIIMLQKKYRKNALIVKWNQAMKCKNCPLVKLLPHCHSLWHIHLECMKVQSGPSMLFWGILCPSEKKCLALLSLIDSPHPSCMLYLVWSNLAIHKNRKTSNNNGNNTSVYCYLVNVSNQLLIQTVGLPLDPIYIGHGIYLQCYSHRSLQSVPLAATKSTYVKQIDEAKVNSSKIRKKTSKSLATYLISFICRNQH